MRLSQFVRLLVVGLIVILAAAPAALAQDEELEPTLAIDLPGADFGERVIVSGTNWPPNSIVQVQICGNLGLNGTSDCDRITTFQSGVSTIGTFGAVMLVGNPPSACPCVFRVTSIVSTLVKTIEFELRGAAVSDGDPVAIALPDRRLHITEARIEGSGPWTALFGGRPDRTLVFTVLNNGFVAVNDPSIVLALGKGADPTGFVTPPSIDRLEPGESRTLRVPLEFPVFAFGTYAVEGSIPGFDTPVEFRAESSHVPWLLSIIPLLILLQVSLVVVRNRVRDRIHVPEHRALPVTVAPTPDLPPPPEPVVIDLREDEPDEVEVEAEPVAMEAEVKAEPVKTEVEVEPVAMEVDAEPTEINLETEPEPAEINVEAEPEPIEIDLEATVDAAPEVADELETIIGEELATVFDTAFAKRDASMNDDEFHELIIDLAGTAADRVASRTLLSVDDRRALEPELAEAVLAAFGFEPNASV